MEFNTDEDVHTIMKYKQQEARGSKINPVLVTVDLDCAESAQLECICKIRAAFFLE